MYWLILLGFLALFVIFVIKAIDHSHHWKKLGIPGPKSLPFAGNIYDLKGCIPQQIEEWTKEYGETFGIQKGRTNILVTSNPALIIEVIVDRFDTFYGREVPPTMGDVELSPRINLFLAAGRRWKRQRTLVNPVFSVKNLKKIMPIIEDSGNVMLKHLEEQQASNKVMDIQPFFFEYTLDIICRTAFGFEDSTQFRNPYRKDLLYLLNNLGGIFTDLSWMFPSIWLPLRYLDLCKKIYQGIGFRFLVKSVRKAVNDRKESRKSEEVNEEPKDFIDMFLNHEDVVEYEKTGEAYDKTNIHVEKKIAIDEIFSNCFLFLIVGYDTTANVLSFTTYFLSQHQDVQDKVRAEIKEVCGDEELTYERLNSLRYTDAVIKETLRFIPIGTSVLNRTASKDTTIGNNIQIKKGDIIQVDTISYHRRKDVWGDDAEEFRPERFLEEHRAEQSYGFGGGPRICVGMRLAYLELKSTLSKILPRYRIKPVPDSPPLKFKPTMILSIEEMVVQVEEL
ncbi:unnamed protein product [Bursaphelenchus okinawaensis]|uniref:Cytochrome P450 n=1 Tax=Bursaphelenchus okinawaensis TaxID=465554 RepID=A0A811LNV7_9BILA|nr:unnamed protein product [Bursaphelenchus okinawaensis]CAG9125117.1 unnamed protein product [Bursaphelenchus okinawaensis]